MGKHIKRYGGILISRIGKKEGDTEERNLVCKINSGKYSNFLSKNFFLKSHVYAVRTRLNKLSGLTNLMVAPKSDVFLIKTSKKISLDKYGFYLDEKILTEDKISFDYLLNSGISVKRRDSKNYQIHKFTPNSFIKMFGDKYLGAGAMIYQQKESDFHKNRKIIEEIWGIDEWDFFEHYRKILEDFNSLLSEKEKLSKIQKFCLNKIKETINMNSNFKESIFTGKNDFDEPFGATYSFIDNNLEKFKITDFFVSQGSGRTRTPTIVIKPK